PGVDAAVAGLPPAAAGAAAAARAPHAALRRRAGARPRIWRPAPPRRLRRAPAAAQGAPPPWPRHTKPGRRRFPSEPAAIGRTTGRAWARARAGGGGGLRRLRPAYLGRRRLRL